MEYKAPAKAVTQLELIGLEDTSSSVEFLGGTVHVVTVPKFNYQVNCVMLDTGMYLSGGGRITKECVNVNYLWGWDVLPLKSRPAAFCL